MKEPWPYDDIVDLPHHVSATRPRMSLANRAAQFTPFAALTGYDAAIEETARLTDGRIELGQNAIDDLDMKLHILDDMAAGHPVVAVTYFQQDERKDGGAYVTATGGVKKVDDYAQAIVFTNGKVVAIKEILKIEGAIFEALTEE